MQTVVSMEPGGVVSAKLHQADEPAPCVAPDLLPAGDGGGACRPDIFLALESLRFPSIDDPPLLYMGDPLPPPKEMPPLEPVLFYDHFEPLDPHFNEAFVVQVPETKEFVPKEQKVRLKPDESAFRETCETTAVIEVRNESTCQCMLNDSNSTRTDDDPLSDVTKLITNYQINILRKSCLRSGRRESSLDLSESYDKDSVGKPKPLERKLTSEFESVASNNTNTTDCDEKCARRTQKRGSPAHLIRSYSLGHERSRRKLTGNFKKFSLPTPAIQAKEAVAVDEVEAVAGLPALPLDTRKVTTLARHYYPEGGWGFVVASCSVMVHVLCHGLQLSAGVLVTPTIVTFNVDNIYAGMHFPLYRSVLLFNN